MPTIDENVLQRLSDEPACFCGSESISAKRNYKGRWGAVPVVRCRKCKTWRSPYFPNEQGVEILYEDTSIYRPPTEEEFSAKRESFRHITQDLISLNIAPGRLVEVGCNAGYALSMLGENGWTVTGVERNWQCAEYARKKVGASVVSGITDLSVNSKFDVALLSHVLEHVVKPVDFLKQIRLRLNVGGRVYIKVPNYGSWVVRHVIRGHWPNFLPFQHLWYFDHRSLSHVLRISGFTVEKIYTREQLSFRGKNVLYSAARLPLALWSNLARYEGSELVGIFRAA